MTKKTAVYAGTRNLYRDMIPAMKSLLVNSDVERIYLLIEDDAFPYAIPDIVTTINVSKQTYFTPDGPNFNSPWTYMVLLKAALTKLLPDEDKILVLDVDTIVDKDISGIWDIPMDGCYVAGAKEPAKSKIGIPYINLGAVLMDLQKMREDGKDDELIATLNTKHYNFCEQDCINELCRGAIKDIPSAYNVNPYTEVTDDKRIFHFAAMEQWHGNALTKKYGDIPFKEIRSGTIHMIGEEIRQKRLQILVPQYKEPDSVVKPLLDSIGLQQGIDMDEIGVIICNDGSGAFLSDELLNSYPYSIEYFHEPHRGVSGTRNACFDHATAEYVMWCDADDLFHSAVAFWIIFREFKYGEFDLMVSEFAEEVQRENGETVFTKHEKDSTFVHGKVFRRQYLIDNEIRWNESLTIHEDSYFNILAQSFSGNVKYCPISFYLWKWRDDSICRHDPKYILKTFNDLIDSNEALITEFCRRGRTHDAEFYVVMLIFDAYYTMNKPDWIDQENKVYRDETERRFARYYKAHKDIWDGAKWENKMKVSAHVRDRHVREGMAMETMTIEDWLRHISSL